MWKRVKSDYYKNFGKETSTFPQENEVYEVIGQNEISYLIFSNTTASFILDALKNVKDIVIWKNI